MGEFDLIAELFAPLAIHKGALGLTDDAALIDLPEGVEAVITKDVMVAGVHFLESTEPALVGRKLLRVNLSDLAAMGAEPLGYWLGVQVPRKSAQDWLASFVEGLRLDQKVFGLSLMGGDTVATPGPIALSLTAMGTVPKGSALRRSGAKPGDLIYVSGTIGDGALGLKAAKGELTGLSDTDRVYLADRLECPTPRLDLGRALRGIASSAIDISDGLVADAGHIAETSGVMLTIDVGKVPLSKAARRTLNEGKITLGDLLTGGDDYELLFMSPAFMAAQIRALGANVSIAEIGVVSEGDPGVKVLENGVELVLETPGFTHF